MQEHRDLREDKGRHFTGEEYALLAHRKSLGDWHDPEIGPLDGLLWGALSAHHHKIK